MNKNIFAGGPSEGFELTDGELMKALGGSGTSDVSGVGTATGTVANGATGLGGLLTNNANSVGSLGGSDTTAVAGLLAGFLETRLG